jgi:hypothetical protein
MEREDEDEKVALGSLVEFFFPFFFVGARLESVNPS